MTDQGVTALAPLYLNIFFSPRTVVFTLSHLSLMKVETQPRPCASASHLNVGGVHLYQKCVLFINKNKLYSDIQLLETINTPIQQREARWGVPEN